MDIWHRLGRICMLFLMWSMRQNEYLADKFAYRIGFGLELATVLDQHLSDVPNDGFLKALYSTHPCNDDRVAALQNLGVPYSRYHYWCLPGFASMIILSKISTKHQYVRLYVIKLFRRYIISNIIPTLINTNNKIKFTGRYPLITSPSTAIPERLPIKNICEISFHIFLYCFIVSIIITIKIPTMKSTATIARILIPHTSPPVYATFWLNPLS